MIWQCWCRGCIPGDTMFYRWGNMTYYTTYYIPTARVQHNKQMTRRLKSHMLLIWNLSVMHTTLSLNIPTWFHYDYSGWIVILWGLNLNLKQSNLIYSFVAYAPHVRYILYVMFWFHISGFNLLITSFDEALHEYVVNTRNMLYY
jgi:hypothetical protein